MAARSKSSCSAVAISSAIRRQGGSSSSAQAIPLSSSLVRYQFLHIGKTGGTTIKAVLRSLPYEHRPKFVLLGHHLTLAEAIAAQPDMPVFFSVRRPETLFVSAFNSRLRQGMPQYDIRWTPRQRKMFSLFKTPNELAEALSAEDPSLKDRTHSQGTPVGTWAVSKRLRSPASSCWRKQYEAHIAFILLQEQLEEDLLAFTARVGVPLESAEVAPGQRFHASLPGDETGLSETGLANVRRWYQAHQDIYDWCRDRHDRMLNEQ